MDAFLQEWNVEFKVEPPEWVFDLSADDKQSENVGRKIGEIKSRIEELKGELHQQFFLLNWLSKVRESGIFEDLSNLKYNSRRNSVHHHVQTTDREEDFVLKKQLQTTQSDSISSEQSPTSPNSDTTRKNSRSENRSDSDQDIFNCSEHYTAGKSPNSDTSPTNLLEEPFSPPAPAHRHRFVHNVDLKDFTIAKSVHQRILEEGRHRSCLNLSHPIDELSCAKSPLGKRKRFHSAPSLTPEHLSHRRLSDKSKKRIVSLPCPKFVPSSPRTTANSTVDSTLKESKLNNSNDTQQKVVLREKTARRPSNPMNSEDLRQWKGSGGTSAVGVKRSSNGILDSYEGYNFIVNNDDDSDPALLNVMASRIRGTLRSPRTSVDSSASLELEKSQVANGGSQDVMSPSDDHRNTPVPGAESVPGDSDSKNIPSFIRKRSTTSDSSPIKRFSYHYSDDECLTPKIEHGDSMFAANSPAGSDGNSHRNSNGVIDEEESPYDLTLVRQKHNSSGALIDRYGTITADNVRLMERIADQAANRHSYSSGEDRDKNESSSITPRDSHGGVEDDEALFEKSSDSYTDELGSLDIDIEYTLSKLRDKPEMSMATLLDMNENKYLNVRHPIPPHTEQSSDDMEGIEIDDATISVFTLNNNLYSSRSNSASSLPGLFSESSGNLSTPEQELPEHESPTHLALQGVNLRQSSGGKKLSRNRMGNADLDMMTGGAGSDNDDKSLSRSSNSLTSEEGSIPTSPEVEEALLSPGSRASRMFPVRHSTVVVHGEQLVIRKLVVVGVVSAEKNYIECLSVIKEYYRKPLLALTTISQPIISEKDISTIFYHIEDLHELHRLLHEQLEVVLSSWSVSSCVGDFFSQLCQNLKLYKDYVEMYQKSVECLNKNKLENPAFKKFLEDVHLTVTKTNKDIPKVNELLRRPIDRLQSYSLVLNDLCQHTPKDHKDYRVLRQSLQAMSDFIASTHDPQAFQELSGGYNREMVKEGLVVELSEGFRKIRRLFLFHDVLVSAKQKPTRTSMKFEPKWYLPLSELRFKCPDDCKKKPVPVSSEMEMSVMKNKIAELKAQVNQYNTRERERSASASGEGFNIKRNIFMIKYGNSNKQSERIKKKLQEQQVSYWVASPSLPLRLFKDNGKEYMFLLHNEEERENWISAIKKLMPKAVNVSLTSFELQDLLSRQTINDLRKVEEMIVPTADDDYLSGVLTVRVISATDLKAKLVGLYCCLELDEYGKFERKARTLPTNTDNATLVTTWDQDFELELVGSHTMKVQVCSKSLLKEETYAHGKVRLPIKELKQNKRKKLKIQLTPQGVIMLVIEYFSSMASVSRKPSLLSSGVFGVPIEVVAKRERHDIPLIVQTCVDEVERRGLEEVGVYRVAGILRDVQELRQSFDTDYLKAQMIAFETDIHAVAGLLKRYFRELPDPLFTDELYLNFVQALGVSDPEARDQCLISLLHSLPPVNFKTAVFLFRHLRRVAANSSENKMTLTNLATIFGPNLLRPGGTGPEINIAAMDVVTPVSVVLYYLNCPEEYFDETSSRNSPDSTAAAYISGGSDERRRGGGGVSAVDGGSHRDSHKMGEEDPTFSPGKVIRRSKRTSKSVTRTKASSVKNTSTNSVGNLTPSWEPVGNVTPSRGSVV